MTISEERWLPVVGYEGKYEVSSLGRIRTIARVITRKNGTSLTVPERIRKLTPDEAGYLIVSFSLHKCSRTRFVHRVVLESFVGPKPPGMECRHLDGNPLNNRLENLRWGTPSENAWDRVKHGTHFHGSKTHCKRGHEFTPENTYESPYRKSKQRNCRACTVLRQQKYFLEKRTA